MVGIKRSAVLKIRKINGDYWQSEVMLSDSKLKRWFRSVTNELWRWVIVTLLSNTTSSVTQVRLHTKATRDMVQQQAV